MADALKAQGNAAFSAGNYAEAVNHFTAAIALDAANHVLYSNRSAALAALSRFSEALEDAQKTVQLKPDWAKGYSRVGAAFHGLVRYDEAVAAYRKGLELDPANEQLQQGLRDAEAAAAAPARGGGDAGIGGLFSKPDAIAKLAMNPSTRGFLAQPDFMSLLAEVQRNPAAAGAHLQDPRFMQCLGVLLGMPLSSQDDDQPPPHDERHAGGSSASAAPTHAPPEELSEEERAAREAKAAAAREKEAGNEAYKRKEFPTALAHYAAGLELDPSDISFYTNRAAVHLETGALAEAVAECDEAVEKGRELRADYKLIARAMARKGNALVKMGDLEGAIASYSKSLMEHRTADTLKRLNDTERALKEKRQREYEDPVKAEEARELGNGAFRDAKYPEAVTHYSEAIKRNPGDHRTYSNRSAAYAKLCAFNEALKDAEKCLELAPTFAKGYSRKGAAQFFMKEFDKALETYQAGLTHDPDSEELKDGVKRCIEQINRATRGQLSDEELKERQARAMQDPEVQAILSDPVMRQVLNDFSTDPKAAAVHSQNEMIMKKLNKLIASGIVQMR